MTRTLRNRFFFIYSKKFATSRKKLPVQNIELEYERKTPREHVLLRPGMYIGQVEPSAVDTYIYEASERKMKRAKVTYSPGLVKIFDEILVNAADNKLRNGKMTSIDVSVQIGKDFIPSISVTNDGRGIPIDFHNEENMYIPELIFGHLLTGSNFNDSAASLTGLLSYKY